MLCQQKLYNIKRGESLIMSTSTPNNTRFSKASAPSVLCLYYECCSLCRKAIIQDSCIGVSRPVTLPPSSKPLQCAGRSDVLSLSAVVPPRFVSPWWVISVVPTPISAHSAPAISAVSRSAALSAAAASTRVSMTTTRCSSLLPGALIFLLVMAGDQESENLQQKVSYVQRTQTNFKG